MGRRGGRRITGRAVSGLDGQRGRVGPPLRPRRADRCTAPVPAVAAGRSVCPGHRPDLLARRTLARSHLAAAAARRGALRGRGRDGPGAPPHRQHAGRPARRSGPGTIRRSSTSPAEAWRCSRRTSGGAPATGRPTSGSSNATGATGTCRTSSTRRSGCGHSPGSRGSGSASTVIPATTIAALWPAGRIATGIGPRRIPGRLSTSAIRRLIRAARCSAVSPAKPFVMRQTHTPPTEMSPVSAGPPRRG